MPTNEKDQSPESLFEAGKRFYFPSQGNDQDPDLALLYFQRAAEGGHAPAQRLYGICLLEGNVCAKDVKGAVRYLGMAADKRDPQASYTLALLHAKGDGVPKDWGKAWGLLDHPNVQALAEARALKARLKQELLALYPNLASSLAGEENALRHRLTPLLQRSFPTFWGKLAGDREEFLVLLDLNLGRKSAAVALGELRALQESYYQGL
ncbi:MAG: hypothetical protein LBF40_06360 [Deltaproteobacteria bacterium]|jgi:hypothetical protein|nr:hypothetical protein [Deltaproteobacteria bacterium]